MAKAKTYKIEDFGKYNWMKDCPCKICGTNKGIEWRIFYYPTCMNGDAEYMGSWCNNHKKQAKEELEFLKNNNE